MSNLIKNMFGGGMNLDSVPSLQPDNTYRVAVNAQHESYDFNAFGIVNEPSNELCFSIPEGYKICGWGLIEERDQFIIFSHNETTRISQIGIGDTKTCTYKIVLDDSDPERFINKLCFSPSEKINPTFKNLRPCNDLWVYWSNGFTYYRLNIDADLCDIKYEDLVLFDCQCPSIVQASKIEDSGELIDVGAYQFVCQLVDDDENKTNWFQIGNPVILTGKDNKLGDKSDQSVLLTISNLPKTYPKVNLAVIKTIGGVQTAEVFTTLYHNGKRISYIYRGKDKDDEPITIQEILARRTGYIRGRDLVQRDGRLFLYNLMEEWNLDAQKYVSQIKTSFIVGKLPADKAGDVPTLPRGEVISLAAVFNYCDGTSSVGFHLPGRHGSKDDFTIIPVSDPKNCTACDKYKWEIENTAFIEEDYCTSNIYSLKAKGTDVTTTPKFIPETVIYTKIDPAVWNYCKQGESNETNGHYISPDSTACLELDNTGADCGDCPHQQIPVGDILLGKVSCPNEEECVDGYCPTTGLPCKFCSSCGGTDYFLEQHIGGYHEYEETGSAQFDGCPNGEPIYDEDGCRIIGYKPSKVAKGKFGYWQSTELYPKSKACDGSYLYGEDAGTPVRHHLVPDESLVMFANSRNMGVIGTNNIDNYEWLNTDVFVIGLEACNIVLPPNPPKPYCPNNPVSIYWQKVDPYDRRVNARGLLTHTFLGKIRNKSYAVPKNAVNSLEYYDRHIETNPTGAEFNGFKKFRGGENIGLPIYNFHSPDTHYEKIPLTADRINVTCEVSGIGERYGICASGEEPLNMWHTTTNERGTRQSINLNQCSETGDTVVISKPGKCLQNIAVNFSLDACGVNEEVFQTCVELVVDKSNVVMFKAVINGEEFVKYNENTICITRKDDNPVVVADYEIEFIVNEGGTQCRYVGGTVLKAKHGKTNCTDSKTFHLLSRDLEYPETKYVGGSLRCIKGISYAPNDSIVDKGDKFTYSLLNLKREGSVYLELEGDQLALHVGIDKYLADRRYNGLGSTADGTSDGSFTGDVRCENCYIRNASAHHAILLNDSPNQYGRIESATYIPLGVDLSADEVICGRVERFGIGDSYIGLHSFRRYSYVTDKVGSLGDQLPPEIERFGSSPLGIDLEVAVDNLLCRHDCSKLPPKCDLFEYEDGDSYFDRRKTINLRGPEDGYESCWPESKPQFNGFTAKDKYHGQTLNTLVHFWTESRINLWKLKTGTADPYHFDFSKNYPISNGAEVHYRRLKNLQYDSSLPEDTPWNLAWLTRIGIKWRTIALLKRITISVVKLLIILGITLIIATLLGGGIFGGISAGIVLAFLLFHDGVNRRVCQWLYSLFYVRQCRPKCLNGGDNCYIVDDDTLPFEENYYGYNWDFNTRNDLETKIGMTDPYNTCICEVGEGNQIVYSQKQNPLSLTDSYKNFLPNSYLNIPADFGKIKSLFSLNNNFYAQTSEMIINIATADGLLDLQNGQILEVLTEGGDLRTRPKELFSDMPEGYAGSVDPNAAINTQYGRFTVDRKAKKIFLFGKGLVEISNFGVRNFLKENLDLELAKQFPEYINIDEVAGIGYKLGFDHRFNKLLFTKIDYKAKHPELLRVENGNSFRLKEGGLAVNLDDDNYFENRSFTLSYDPNTKAWISFHTYFPEGYAYDRDHLYSIKDGEFWKHGDKYGEFQMFYGKYHPHIIEFVAKQKDLSHSTLTDIEFDVEASEFDGKGWIKGKEDTFNRLMAYNDSNNTGEVDLVFKDKSNAIANITQKVDESIIDWQKDFVRINQLRNRVIDKDVSMFDGRGTDGLDILNKQIIDKESRNNRFEGKYLVARLILDNPDMPNLQHLTKQVLTTQDKTKR